MDDLSLECPVHLDGVPLKDMRIFKCGHGLCITCIDTLFAGASPFKCPTCRKHIYLEDALQIFLNPHRSPTQHTTQSTPKGSDVAIQSGARLRKAVTKDRSSVAISGIVIGEVSPRPASPPAATSPAQFAHSPVPGAPAMTQGSSNIRTSQDRTSSRLKKKWRTK